MIEVLWAGCVVAHDAEPIRVSLLPDRLDLPLEQLERRFAGGHADRDGVPISPRIGDLRSLEVRVGSGRSSMSQTWTSSDPAARIDLEPERSSGRRSADRHDRPHRGRPALRSSGALPPVWRRSERMRPEASSRRMKETAVPCPTLSRPGGEEIRDTLKSAYSCARSRRVVIDRRTHSQPRELPGVRRAGARSVAAGDPGLRRAGGEAAPRVFPSSLLALRKRRAPRSGSHERCGAV